VDDDSHRTPYQLSRKFMASRPLSLSLGHRTESSNISSQQTAQVLTLEGDLAYSPQSKNESPWVLFLGVAVDSGR
jgi:hypothetical protein